MHASVKVNVSIGNRRINNKREYVSNYFYGPRKNKQIKDTQG